MADAVGSDLSLLSIDARRMLSKAPTPSMLMMTASGSSSDFEPAGGSALFRGSVTADPPAGGFSATADPPAGGFQRSGSAFLTVFLLTFVKTVSAHRQVFACGAGRLNWLVMHAV